MIEMKENTFTSEWGVIVIIRMQEKTIIAELCRVQGSYGQGKSGNFE